MQFGSLGLHILSSIVAQVPYPEADLVALSNLLCTRTSRPDEIRLVAIRRREIDCEIKLRLAEVGADLILERSYNGEKDSAERGEPFC